MTLASSSRIAAALRHLTITARLAMLALGIGSLAQRVASAEPLLAAPFLSFDAGKGPFAVAIGDLNRDGRRDLVVANNYEATVSVLLGNGDGTFGAWAEYTSGGAPHSVALGDLDGNARGRESRVGSFMTSVAPRSATWSARACHVRGP